MSLNMDEQQQVNSAVEGISHEFVIRSDNHLLASQHSTTAVAATDTITLNLTEGENWLRLVVSLDKNSVLMMNTQETTSMSAKPFPTITSLSEVGTIDAPTEDCYMCIDVDGPYVAIKDMRAPLTSQDSEEEDVFQVCLAKRKKRHEKLAALADSQVSQGNMLAEQYHDLELLERRQLKILHPGDLITVAGTAAGDGGENGGLVLEYRQYRGETRHGRDDDDDETQENSMVGVVIQTQQASTAAAGDTQASKSSDPLRTQPEDPSPRSEEPSPQSDDEAYKTAIEPTQESCDDSSSEEEGDAGEATQAFPAPFTQSPQPKSNARAGGVDQSFSVYQTPLSEEEAGKKEATDDQAKSENENATMGTQPEDDDETADEEVDPMNQSTQTIPTPKEASQNDEASSTKQLAKAIGSQMSPIVEESEAPTPDASREDTVLEEQEPSQASTTLGSSKKGTTPSDDIDSETSGPTQGDPIEEDEGSDSDALLDDEDVKDASANVKATPQKQTGTTTANDSIDENGGERIAGEAGLDKQNPAANTDEAMSDSSSITEIDEATPKKPRENSGGEKVKDVSAPAAEPPTPNKDDASHASSITEADVMISPHKGLVMASRRETDASMEVAAGEWSSVRANGPTEPGVAEKPADVANESSNVQTTEDSTKDPSNGTKGGTGDDGDNDGNDDETVGDAPSVQPHNSKDTVNADDALTREDQEDSDGEDDETIGNESTGQPDSSKDLVNAGEKGAVVGGEASSKPDQEDLASKPSDEANDDDDETIVDENDKVEATKESVETSLEETVAGGSSPQPKEDKGADNAPVADPNSVNDDSGEEQQKVVEAEVPTDQGADKSAEFAGGIESLSDPPSASDADPSDKATRSDAGESVDETPKEPGSQIGAEGMVAAETGPEMHSPGEAPEETAGHHESQNHSAETEVADNRSPAVCRNKPLDEKSNSIDTSADIENPVEEAKGVEEAEAAGDKSEPATERNEAESPAIVENKDAGTNKNEKDNEEEETKTETVDEAGTGKPEASKPLKKRKLSDEAETATAKERRRGRANRSKASAAPEEEIDSKDEEPAEMPTKKRSTRRKAAQPKEDEGDESLQTPAKKRGRAGRQVRGSARKRTRGADTPSSPDQTAIRVLMTGVGETDKHKKMVTSIGGEVIDKIEDAHTATHVIAGDDQTSLRRTPKLMIGMCRTSKIVHMNWLTKSAKAREPLACNDFLLLKDRKAEKQYGFVMREALQRGDELRRNGEFLLSDYWVYVCKGVAGNKAPPEKELELIVDAAGGTWLSSISARTMKDIDASKLIIVTPAEKSTKKKAKTTEAKDVEKAIKLGAETHPAAWLFDCIIKQSVED